MKSFSPRRLTKPGMIVSVVYLIAIGTYLMVERSAVFAMRPSEFGDFLAGAFSPLAFLWLVLGFFQQGDELRNSVAALHLQGEELRNSVEQQRQLVDVTREQLGLELETKEAARLEEVRKASPIFHISGGFSQWSSPTCTSKFIIRNIGAQCRNVRVSDTDGLMENHPSFGNRSSCQITYDTIKNQEVDSKEITIECVDVLGQPRLFKTVVTPESGHYGVVYAAASEDGLLEEIL